MKTQSDSEWDSVFGSDGDPDEYSSTDDLLPDIQHPRGSYKYTYAATMAKEKALRTELNVKTLTQKQEHRLQIDGLRRTIAHHHQARAERAARRAAKLAADAQQAAEASRQLTDVATGAIADPASFEARAALRAEIREARAARTAAAPIPADPDAPIDVDMSNERGLGSPSPPSDHEDGEQEEPMNDE
jgi:hypothetical protein